MSLFDALLEIEDFTPSRQPTSGQALELLGKAIAYLEHGDELLKAADADRQAKAAGEPANHVNELLSPPPPEEAPSALSAADFDHRIAQLEQERATLIATQQRTQAETDQPDTEGEGQG